jgi:hypothetical protein
MRVQQWVRTQYTAQAACDIHVAGHSLWCDVGGGALAHRAEVGHGLEVPSGTIGSCQEPGCWGRPAKGGLRGNGLLPPSANNCCFGLKGTVPMHPD